MAPARNNASPVWILQFIDPTIETGFCYKYRIQLKLQNPNFSRAKHELAFPGLAAVEELRYEEIAKVLDCPIGTVKSRLFHARADLARRLRPYMSGVK